jgi:hypothetical protein
MRVKGHSQPAEPIDDARHALDSVSALHRQKIQQCRGSGIDEIAENVDVGFLTDCGDFDARHELHTHLRAGPRRIGAPRYRVVIGEAEGVDSGLRREPNEFFRRAASVGSGRVGV